jgi:hypothetical protein
MEGWLQPRRPRSKPWRVQFNKDIKRKPEPPEVQLIITDGRDKTEKQVADVENLIAQQVDVLLIAGIGGLTGVVEKRSTPRSRDRARPQRRHQAHHAVHRRHDVR